MQNCKVGEIIYYRTNDERIAALTEIQHVRESLTEFLDTLQLDNDPKRALRQSLVLRFVPLTELQATRANRLAHLGPFNEAMHLLSPRRGSLFMQALKITAQISLRVVVDVPILPAGMSLCDKQVLSDGAPKTGSEVDPTDIDNCTAIGALLNLRVICIHHRRRSSAPVSLTL
jgi:hypothetical protein